MYRRCRGVCAHFRSRAPGASTSARGSRDGGWFYTEPVTKIRITASDACFEAAEGESLLRVLQANGHPIATACGGVASCGLCRLTVVEGGEALSPLRPQELVHLGNVAKIVGLRLACQATVCGPGPVEVAVPAAEEPETRRRRKMDRLRRDRERHRSEEPRVAAGEAGTARIEWRPRVLGKPRP